MEEKHYKVKAILKSGKDGQTYSVLAYGMVHAIDLALAKANTYEKEEIKCVRVVDET